MNVASLFLLVGLVLGAGVAWRRGTRGTAFGLAAVAALPGMAFVSSLAWPALLVVLGLAAVLVWHRWSRSRATVSRWSARSRRKAGVASSLDVARHAGTLATRRRASTVRPSLRGAVAPGAAARCRHPRWAWSCAGWGCSGCGPRSRT